MPSENQGGPAGAPRDDDRAAAELDISEEARGPLSARVPLSGATPIEVKAICVAMASMVGTPFEAPLVGLLRRISPDSETLGRLDALAREHAECVADAVAQVRLRARIEAVEAGRAGLDDPSSTLLSDDRIDEDHLAC